MDLGGEDVGTWFADVVVKRGTRVVVVGVVGGMGVGVGEHFENGGCGVV